MSGNGSNGGSMNGNGSNGAGAREEGAAEGDDAKHNKYCHFCQHVKVKRASSMLACDNAECARRFCEHCLVTHLDEVTEGAPLSEVDGGGKWLCPICRKLCCCSIQHCARPHRHCKAYRYRQRRAEQAAKRTLAAGEGANGNGSPLRSPAAKGKKANAN